MWKYFIPLFGLVYMLIKPHETDDARFALGFIAVQLSSTSIPLGIYLWLQK